ncbi:MAG: ArnT family glycosyltransferase [Vicinamibacterales bacterium]
MSIEFPASSRPLAESIRFKRVWLLLVMAVGAWFRFSSLDYGVPYAVGIDEPEIMVRVIAMMKSGDYNPHFFHYPGLIFYLHLPIAVARFLAGALWGEWQTVEAIAADDFYIWSRALSAILGVLTIGIVYAIGKRWGTREALLAAAIMAIMPLHVRESRYVLADVPATFFVAMTWLATLLAQERQTTFAFVVAGAVAGLSTAIKYHVGLVLLIPLLAACVPTTVPAAGRVTGVLAAFAGAFLAGAPYTVLDLTGFLNSFANLLVSFPARAPGAEPGVVIYLKHLRLNLGWPLFLVAALGLAFSIWRSIAGPDRARWALLALFPSVFLYAIAGRHQIYARYLLPMLPFVAVMSASVLPAATAALGSRLRSRLARGVLSGAITVGVLAVPVVVSVQHLQMLATPTTLARAYAWITTNVPTGSSLVVETFDIRFPTGRYEVRHVPRLAAEQVSFYREQGVRYLVANSRSYGPFLANPEDNPTLTSRYLTLFRAVREVTRFSPGPDRTGPEIRILAVDP